uniref:Uncharacterized protein n=1 Tax=Romanomermis culicivorax TaxID=13658 RepID=A0A915IYZ6_ROMCU
MNIEERTLALCRIHQNVARELLAEHIVYDSDYESYYLDDSDFKEMESLSNSNNDFRVITEMSEKKESEKDIKTVKLADDSITDYFKCRNCVKLGGQKRTRVKNVRLISNPEAGHNQLCAPIDAIALKTLSLSGDMIKLAENGTKPIRAYREGLAETPNGCADPNFLNQVQLAVPAF